jgi:hypothetical protein
MKSPEKAPAFQWYPKDVLTSVRVQMMTLAEEGAYRRLIDFCWLNGSIPNDESGVSRLIGKGATVAIARVCMDMFEVCPDDPTILIHDRLDQEREKQQSNSEARRKASEARWNKQGTTTDARGKQVKSVADANAMQMDMQNDALHISSSSSSSSPEKKEEKDKPIGLSKKKIGTRIPDNFELTDEMIDYAKAKAPNVSVSIETEKFKNFWKAKSGAGGVKLDWAATWRNWMLSAQERYEERNGKNDTNRSSTQASDAEFYDSIGARPASF